MIMRLILNLTKIGCAVLMLTGFSDLPSCSGPVEFAGELPRKDGLVADESLVGWWHGAASKKHMGFDILLVVAEVKKDEAMVLWHLPGMGVCWMASAYVTEVDGAIYYVARRISADESGEISRCEDYTAEGAAPGNILVKLALEGRDRLQLRFVRTRFFERVGAEDGMSHQVVKPPDDEYVVNQYLLVQASPESLVGLVREYSEKGLFTDPPITLNRIVTDRENVLETNQPWRK